MSISLKTIDKRIRTVAHLTQGQPQRVVEAMIPIIGWPEKSFSAVFRQLTPDQQAAWNSHPDMPKRRQKILSRNREHNEAQRATQEAFRLQQGRETQVRDVWEPAIQTWRATRDKQAIPPKEALDLLWPMPNDAEATSEGWQRHLDRAQAHTAHWWATLEREQPNISPDALWAHIREAQFDFPRSPTVGQVAGLLDGRWGRTAKMWSPLLKVAHQAAVSQRKLAQAADKLARKQAAETRQAEQAKVQAQRQIERDQFAAEAAYVRTLLNVTQVANCLGVTAPTVRAMIKRQELAVARIRSFRKWGKDLESTLHDPGVVQVLRVTYQAKRPRSSRPETTAQRAYRLIHLTPQEKTQREAWQEAALAGQPDAQWLDLRRLQLTFSLTIPAHWPVLQVHLVFPDDTLRRLAPGDRQEAPDWSKFWKRVAQQLSVWNDALLDQVKASVNAWDKHHQAQVLAALPVILGMPQNIDVATLTGAPSGHPWQEGISRQVQRMMTQDAPWGQLAWAHVACVDIPQWFPKARARKRRWTVWIGPTNSGKTYAAMEALKAAPNGIYLAPLRLMALEAFDRLVTDGLACSLITGEEQRQSRPGPTTHVAATIEAGLSDAAWEVAVIDEAQMLGDDTRGWAWTQALLGIDAAHVCVCAAPQAEAVLRALAGRLGEPIEVHHLERACPLQALNAPVALKTVQAGDAIVGFSRSQVLGYRAWLRERGHQVACLYGDLGPEVRQAEAERFRSGAAQVLVATDAIGMGLNLPLKRVLFAATQKYDGCCTRDLRDQEWQQIGGRAGRRGFHETGEVGVLQGQSPKDLHRALHSRLEDLEGALPIHPTQEVILRVAHAFCLTRLCDVLGVLMRKLPEDKAWDLTSLRGLESATWTRHVSSLGIPMALQWGYLGCPIRRSNESVVVEWAQKHAQGGVVRAPNESYTGWANTPDDLACLEASSHLLTVYRWLARHFPEAYPDYALASERNNHIQEMIADCLAGSALRRLCRTCGHTLPVNHEFPECERCYQERQNRREWRDEGW